MALTKVTGQVVNTSTDLTVGVLTATTVSVGGTLTYEDVTNVDSVGLITARNGIEVTDKGVQVGTGATVDSAAANTLTFLTGGSERVRIDGSGNVGIGTASPSSALHLKNSNANFRIESTSATGASVIQFGDPDDIDVGSLRYEHNGNALRFITNASERARIDSSGRLLIGTSSSKGIGSGTAGGFQLTSTSHTIASITAYSNSTLAGTLVLGKSRGTSIGSDTIVQDGDNLGEIRFAGADGSDLVSNGAKIAAQVDGTPGSDDMPGRLVFMTTADGASTSTERMRIDSSGFIHQKFTSDNSSTPEGLFINNQNNGTGNNASLILSNDSGNRKKVAIAAVDVGSYGASDLVFALDGADSGSVSLSTDEKMRIDSSGNMGLGTASPSAPFHIDNPGDTSITQILETGNAQVSLVLRNSTSTGNNIQLNATGNDFRILTNATEAMRIDSSGRIGMGNDSPGSYSAVADDLVVGNHSGAHGITIAAENNNTAYLRFADGTANSGQQANGQIAYSHADITMRFNVDASERMRIDSSGRLLVGTSSEIVSGSANSSVHLVDGGGGKIYMMRDDSGSTVAGNDLGMIRFYSNDGTAQESARIEAEADLDHGLNDKPGRLVFSTTADGGSSPTERMRIDSSGNVGINHNSPQFGLTIGQTANDSGKIGWEDGSQNKRASITCSSSTDALQFHVGTSDTERMRINNSGQVLIGQTSASSVLGTGLGLKSGSVGSAFNTGALSLTGANGDFYALTFSQDGSNNSNAFGFLSIFSSATDSLRVGYNNGSTNTTIAYFFQNGNFTVAGALSKGSGSFRIDHPLPAKTETHDLVHSFIEGPQADLIYRGKVDLVAGAATVNLDTAARMTEGTFVLLNTNVQCFTTNESDWTAVRGSVSGNTLTIAAEDNTSTATVSWLVIGERQDQHMLDTDWTDDNGRVITEPEKSS